MSTSFTVMTWNVENLFRPNTGGQKLDQAGYDRKLANLAEVIGLIRPSVLGLQELGGEGPLADLQAALGGDYPHAVFSEKPDDRGIGVGFLSRLAFTSENHLTDMPAKALTSMPDGKGGTITEMGRGAVEIAVRPGGRTVHVITAHLKSKLVTYANGKFFTKDEDERARGAALALARRTAEAVALRVYANTLMIGNQTPLLLVGDLNDSPDAVTTQILLGPLDGDPTRPDQGDDVRLYNLADKIPEADRYTRIFNGQHELIDHVLVSYDILFDVQQVDTYTRSTPSITANPDLRRKDEFTDHSPVFARFMLP
jgi:endonuclease/exonuclease/phosphatase family metal-dependent hydrolase